MGFAMNIISRDEAMALPIEQRPLCFRIPEKIYTSVFEAVGAASMAWKPRPSTEVFNSEEAEKIAVDLCFIIAGEIERLQKEWPKGA